MGWLEAGPLAPGRTISTEQGAVRRTACATLPSRKRPMALCPCEPTIMRSACHSLAYSEMARRGKPMTTSASALCPEEKSFSTPALTIRFPSRLASSMRAGSRAKRWTSTTFTTEKPVSAGQGHAAASSSTRSDDGEESTAIITFVLCRLPRESPSGRLRGCFLGSV